MGTVPQNAKLRLEWYEAHIAQLAANAVAIGTTTGATTDLQTKITAARTKFLAKNEAEGAAKVATSEWHAAIDAVGLAGSAIIDQVRGKAKVAGSGIYDLAGIPAPATPSPVGPPGTPTNLGVELNPDGSIKMTWKCVNPSNAGGPIYHVYRSLTTVPADYEFVGGAGLREFTDSDVPAGAAVVYYKIQAVRTTSVGQTADFMVRFGTPGSGGVSVTAMNASTPKMAA